MQLNEILEENSVKEIGQKTKISEENLQSLLNADFGALKKIKTLGFISIIEREYQADLNALREEALEYYREHEEDNSYSVHLPIEEEKKNRSKLFIFIVLSILVYASWYFFTQFDKKHLSQLIPFMGNQPIENGIPATIEKQEEKQEENIAADLSIENIVVKDIQAGGVIEKTVEAEDVQANVEAAKDVGTEVQSISIVPVGQLWFGVIDMQTNEKEHFTIAYAYELDVETKSSWLLATSAAPFSLVTADETRDFNDAKEHYFKIDKNGIQPLTRDEYISLGGWSQW